ncbi:hypothetical protein PXH59_00590 (plasmid) [Xenorhabdus sp. SF857]|uniref:hypothetical protein n=1 Tax=Xenorhabdus bakwenae TaxID=3026967 RepID=UPI0025583883|nr:hypothetical protein [Xenorhabdus sp. SF857]WFQ78176.1 hypothetical protein PXH59_00590 [Xenorhabdus sp. SF857]
MRHFFSEYRDSILAFVGIIIACISLGFTLWLGKEQIKHNHVSVGPRLNAYFTHNGKNDREKWGIYVINNGMGTAFVTSITVTVDGKPVNAVDNNIFVGAAQALGLDPNCFLIGGPRPNDSFKVGEEILLIETGDSDKSCAIERLRFQLASQPPQRLDFVLDIESIYGDKFRYTLSQNRQIRLGH